MSTTFITMTIGKDIIVKLFKSTNKNSQNSYYFGSQQYFEAESKKTGIAVSSLYWEDFFIYVPARLLTFWESNGYGLIKIKYTLEWAKNPNILSELITYEV